MFPAVSADIRFRRPMTCRAEIAIPATPLRLPGPQLDGQITAKRSRNRASEFLSRPDRPRARGDPRSVAGPAARDETSAAHRSP